MRFTQLAFFAFAAVVGASTVPTVPNGVLGKDGIYTVDLSGLIDDVDVEEFSSPNISSLEKKAEVVTCYNVGTKIDRVYAIRAIDNFCGAVMGKYYANNQRFTIRYTFGNRIPQHMLVSLEPINNCGGFTVDGNCGRLLRLPVDRCNTGGENGKQGGYMTDPCGQWRSDPGTWQTDCIRCVQDYAAQLGRACASLPAGAAEACYNAAAVNARNACESNGNCCSNSGLGPNGNNCDRGFDDY